MLLHELANVLRWVERNFNNIAPAIDEKFKTIETEDGTFETLELQRLRLANVAKNDKLAPGDKICSPIEHASMIYVVSLVFLNLTQYYAKQLSGQFYGHNPELTKDASEIMDEIKTLAEIFILELPPNQSPF